MPPLVQIPETAGPVCIAYNLPELKAPLRLSAETLSGIYLGKIKSWQDPVIKNDNPGVVIQSHNIIVVHALTVAARRTSSCCRSLADELRHL
jgi:phosphate transport system substrate-binding protein